MIRVNRTVVATISEAHNLSHLLPHDLLYTAVEHVITNRDIRSRSIGEQAQHFGNIVRAVECYVPTQVFRSYRNEVNHHFNALVLAATAVDPLRGKIGRAH